MSRRTCDRDDARFATPRDLFESFCCDQITRIETRLWNRPWGDETGMLRDDRLTPACCETTIETRGHGPSMCGHPGRLYREDAL